MARFFINTGDGFEFATTEEEARKVATEAVEFWRRAAIDDGEWSDEITSVFWGEIREKVRAVSVGDDGDYTDYQLRPVKSNAAAFTGWLDTELQEATCPEFLAAIKKVRTKFAEIVNAE